MTIIIPILQPKQLRHGKGETPGPVIQLVSGTARSVLFQSRTLPQPSQDPHSSPALPNPLTRLKSLLGVHEPLLSAILSQ